MYPLSRYRAISPVGERLGIYHLDGVEWYRAPLPSRWHLCWAQTRQVDAIDFVERCACGAIRNRRLGTGPFTWLERNSRRRQRRLSPDIRTLLQLLLFMLVYGAAFVVAIWIDSLL